MSTTKYHSQLSMLPARFVVLYPFLLIASCALMMGPGLIVGGWLARHRELRALYIVPVAALTAAVIGYGSFWAWFVSPYRGPWFSGALLLGQFAAVVWLLARPSGRRMMRQLDVAAPLALVLLIALFYNAAVTSCLGAGEIPCVFGGPSWDNVLPQFFAEHVAQDQPRMLVGDWLGSDRPPLQSGVVLNFNPLTRDVPFADTSYQALGSVLQCLWVVAAWVVARRLRLSTAAIAIVVIMCAGTGFFYDNSVYVWPKLLAAALGLMGFCLLVTEPRRILHYALAGAFFATGMLSHSGIVFTLLPLGAVLLLHRRYRPSLKMAAAGLAVAAALMGPWLAYQKFYDPPGNRLMKWHLAGVGAIDDRSITEALVDSYSSTPAGKLVDAKLSNLELLVNVGSVRMYYAGSGEAARLRGVEWVVTAAGIGLLNLGWLGLAIPGIRRRWMASGVDRRLARLMVAIGSGALLIWALSLFLPTSTFIHQGSYLTMMLLMVSFAAMLTVWPKRILVPLMAIQLGYFAFVWIASYYMDGQVHNIPRKAIALMLVALAGLAVLFWQLIRRSGPTPEDHTTPESGPTHEDPGEPVPVKLSS